MEKREVIAYAITHAPRGQKGGPYEGLGRAGAQVPTLRETLRWRTGKPIPETLRHVRKVHPHARVIRIVRKARPSPSEAEPSAVEVLRGMLATWEARGIIRVEAFEAARRILAASGPDPAAVVRAAMAWSEATAANGTARTVALQLACVAYRKAGGK